MRLVAPILILLAVLACARAQDQESGMMARLDASRDQALDAINNQKKKHPELASPMMNKSFQGGGNALPNKKASGVGTFNFDKKMASGSYTTRSFLGIKNPWFGNKVATTNTASLWSKTAVQNADKKFDVKTENVKDFYQADKKMMNRDNVTETKPYLVRGAAQGAIDQETSKAKDMTIDQVRDLLNKSKTRKQAQAAPITATAQQPQ